MAKAPFSCGRLFKGDCHDKVEGKDYSGCVKVFKAKGGVKCDYKCQCRQERPWDSGSTRTPFLTGRLYKVVSAVHWITNSQAVSIPVFQGIIWRQRISKGHSRLGRPFDSVREVDAIRDMWDHFGKGGCTRWIWRSIGTAWPLE